MTYLQALLLSFVQSATEFLPVSSSGHLLFLKGAFGLTEIPIIFDVVLHIGSLAAIVFFYRKRLIKTAVGAWQALVKREWRHADLVWVLYLVIATLVTGAVFALAGDGIESRFDKPETLSYTYIITTLVLLATRFTKEKCVHELKNISWHWILLVGAFQAMAMLPGVSRSGSTIAPLILLGLARTEAGYFAFGLAIPAILGAFVFELSDIGNQSFIGGYTWIITLGFVSAAVFSYLFLRLLNWVLKKNSFWIFSAYTGAMAVACWTLFGF